MDKPNGQEYGGFTQENVFFKMLKFTLRGPQRSTKANAESEHSRKTMQSPKKSYTWRFPEMGYLKIDGLQGKIP